MFAILFILVVFGTLFIELWIMNGYSRLENIFINQVKEGDGIIGKDNDVYIIHSIDNKTMLIVYSTLKDNTRHTVNWYEFAKIVSLSSLEEQYGKFGFLDKLFLKLNLK